MVTSREEYLSACEGYRTVQAVRDIQAGRDITDMQNIRCASDAWREHLLNSAEKDSITAMLIQTDFRYCLLNNFATMLYRDGIIRPYDPSPYHPDLRYQSLAPSLPIPEALQNFMREWPPIARINNQHHTQGLRMIYHVQRKMVYIWDDTFPTSLPSDLIDGLLEFFKVSGANTLPLGPKDSNDLIDVTEFSIRGAECWNPILRQHPELPAIPVPDHQYRTRRFWEHSHQSLRSPLTMNCPQLPLEIWEIILRLTEDPITVYHCRFLCRDFNQLSNEIFGCGFNRPPRCIRDPTQVPWDSQIMITHDYLEAMVATALDVDTRMISELFGQGVCPRNCDLIDGLVIEGEHLRNLRSVTFSLAGVGRTIPMNFEHEHIEPHQTYLINLFGNHPIPTVSLCYSEIRFTSDPPLPLKYSGRHLLATERDTLARGSDPNWSNPLGCSPSSNYFQVGSDIWSSYMGCGYPPVTHISSWRAQIMPLNSHTSADASKQPFWNALHF